MVQLLPLHPKTPSSLALSKARLVLPFWYRLTQDVYVLETGVVVVAVVVIELYSTVVTVLVIR